MAALTGTRRTDRFGKNRWLHACLEQPVVSVSLDELPQHWQQTDIHFICDAPAGFQSGAWMARSVRGALGRLLRARQTTPTEAHLPATSFEALYQNHFKIGLETNAVHGPKPIRIIVTHEGGRIDIRVRLFGFADMWRDNVIEAMAIALGQGIGLWENGRILRPWPVRDWHFTRTASFALPSCTGRARLSFKSPFKPGSSEVFSGGFADNLPSLAVRLRGIARWFLTEVAIDRDAIAVATAALRERVVPPGYRLSGFSKRTATGEVLVVGVEGTIELSPVSELLWPVLWLGSLSGAGGHGVYGFGEYDCTAV